MFLGRFSGVTPVFAARSTCHVGGRLVTSNHFSLPSLSVSTVLLHAPLHTPNCTHARAVHLGGPFYSKGYTRTSNTMSIILSIKYNSGRKGLECFFFFFRDTDY